MKLYALTDFSDDCTNVKYTPEMVDSLVRQLSEYGFSRLYFQYYGNREDEYFWTTEWEEWKTIKETAEIMPNMSKVFVDACKRHGLQTAGVMRPLEQGIWTLLSPYHKNCSQPPISQIGGDLICPSAFLKKHPELRIKRRSFDIDENAINKTISSIKLYKQNNIPTRIKKENIIIYTSPDNSFYKPYEKDFTFEILEEPAKEDTVLAIPASTFGAEYSSRVLCRKGDLISVIKLSNLNITDRFVAIGVKCDGECSEDEYFINTPVNTIACFEENGDEICATVGCTKWVTPGGGPHLEEGFNFDDGFGVNYKNILDPDGKEGFIAIAKGKNNYNHGALCESEPLVQEYWFSLLEKALEDGYDFIGNRIECHSVQINEPFAYGYNDCIKDLYFNTYGKCDEKDIDLQKLSKIRGDVYSELFSKGAAIVRKKGAKVYLTLNIEMLYNPIPLDRLGAYPMNVEWQWERWLKEIQPDEINFRMYQSTPEFFLRDSQCRHMLEIAKSYNVPMTIERYITRNMVEEYKLLNETGLFDAFIVYETASLFHGTPDGKVYPYEKVHYGNVKEILTELKRLSTDN